jgi:hypothetical protein
MKHPTREDYELAAKAAGIVLDGLASAHIVQGVRPDDYLIRNDKGGHSVWNPLHDDGDSRRLQAALKLDVLREESSDGEYWIACYYTDDVNDYRDCAAWFKDHKDAAEALRHAVFWLAVEIGRAMP